MIELNDTVGALENRRAAAQAEKAKIDERRKQYAAALNRICSSPDGVLVMQEIIDYCGIHKPQTQFNPAKLVEDNGKKLVYLQAIRPFIEPVLRAEIEK